MHKEVIGDATLYLGDCLEIISTLTFDVVITDPPYGVDFKGKKTKHRRRNGGYIGEDSGATGPEFIRNAGQFAKRMCVFSGTRNAFNYPVPDDIGAVMCPSGTGMGKWGFVCIHPILFYGKATMKATQTPNSFQWHGVSEESRHPCAKPLHWMQWAVEKTSLPGEVVLDGFAGSGTTGVACIELGRKFIGIEIEQEYFDIACERIKHAQSQGKLFSSPESYKDYLERHQLTLDLS